ncbi:Lrp/AsnC family transcriptional regulator [Saccharopolyspora shandongensis]|uniref:Lrp/AsnC family transcriptional regulator n=1 Tax=Saccharopolyspora shandongensis TaxID=418495 RepID=UPI00342DD9F9
MDDLDDLDRQLIAALQLDGRRSFSSLAEEFEIPASSVRYRVKRLEDEGILQIVGIANPLAIGFDRLAMIGVAVRPGAAREVSARLAALPESSYVVMTSGRYDLMVEVICRDLAHYVDVIEDKIGSIDGVVSTESFLVLEVHKLAYGWGVPGVDREGPAAGRPTP